MNWGFDVLIYGIFCSLWGLGLGIMYGMAVAKKRWQTNIQVPTFEDQPK